MSTSDGSRPTSAASVGEETYSAFPKDKMGKKPAPHVQPSCHSDTLPFAQSDLYFFSVAIILSLPPFPALLITDVAFSVLAAPQSSDLYKIRVSTFPAEQIKS